MSDLLELPVTNIIPIDEQHKKIIALMRDFFNTSLEKNLTQEILLKKLQEIHNYFVEHFEAEDFLMRSINYPNEEQHSNQHNYFMEVCGDSLKKLETAESLNDFAADVNSDLVGWFFNHVQKEDMKMAEFIRKKLG
jgi:hemerythrin-like metal-binding protein